MSFSKFLSAANATTEMKMLSRAVEILFVVISLSSLLLPAIVFVGDIPSTATLLSGRIYRCARIVRTSAVFSHPFNVLGGHILCNESAGRCEVSKTSF